MYLTEKPDPFFMFFYNFNQLARYKGISKKAEHSESLKELLLLFFFFYFFFFFSSSSIGPVSLCPGCASALGLLYNPKYSIQHRFNSPVRIKRQRSLTEAVLISFGSTSGFPRTL
jgi:hypothetical protein